MTDVHVLGLRRLKRGNAPVARKTMKQTSKNQFVANN